MKTKFDFTEFDTFLQENATPAELAEILKELQLEYLETSLFVEQSNTKGGVPSIGYAHENVIGHSCYLSEIIELLTNLKENEQ
jgi:hypothetical protein